MESDMSYSGSGSGGSSASSSSGSLDGEDCTEVIKVLDQTVEVPQGLCEDYAVFKEFFSMKTWESISDENKKHLKTFLPTFPSNDSMEKDKTLTMLFNKDLFHFTSPFNAFYDNLKQGNYRPEMVDMIEALKETQDEYRQYKVHSYYSQLLPDVILSRERVLAAVRAAPPGPVPCLPPPPPEYPESERYLPPHKRAKTRFFQELSAIRAEVGGETSDEEDSEPHNAAKKRRIDSIPTSTSSDGVSSTIGGGPASVHKMDSLKKILAAHKKRRSNDDDSPELDTTGITLDDIKQRAGIGFDPTAKRPMFGGPKLEPAARPRKVVKKEPVAQTSLPPKLEPAMSPPPKVEEPFSTGLTLDSNPLLPNIKIKDEHDDHSDLHSLVDPMKSPPSSNRPYSPDLGDADFDFGSLIKDEPFDSLRHPLKLEDLDGIAMNNKVVNVVYTSSDMMNLPIELADDPCDVLSGAFNDPPLFDPEQESLSETTYPNFLCLVRALFPASSAHRASKRELQARCAAVMRSTIAPLNDWYNGSEDWCMELDSALDFLAGDRGEHPDDFVPYLQFIPETQMYQWIGAGRDGDQTLGILCERWLHAAAQSEPSFYEPPPPMYPTSWVVRQATNPEIAEFRAQERRRFSAATKPFSYIQHGYRGVVGPCARAASWSAHSSLLTRNRPRHVTFMALVCDAVARLPNGEGNRQQILTMLKMTQYIRVEVDDQTLLSSISSTLDRLYTEKRDPVVKYDHRNSVWTYLHRNRTEEDWLRATENRSTSRKSSNSPRRKTPQTSKSAGAPTHTVTQPGPSSTVTLEQADDGSDIEIDIDVDDASVTPAHLSSAQLLRQATKSLPDQVIVQRPNKGKLVFTNSETTSKKPKPKPKARSTKSSTSKAKRSPQQTSSNTSTSKTVPVITSPTSRFLQRTPVTHTQTSASMNTHTKATVSPPKPALPRTPLQPFARTQNKRPIGKSDFEMDYLTSEELDALAMPAPAPPPPAKPPQTPLPPQPNHARSLLIKSLTTAQTIVTASNAVPISSDKATVRRLLSSAVPTAGKSLIAQKALGATAPPPANKPRTDDTPVSTPAVRSAPVLSYPQGVITTTVASSAPTTTTASLVTRTVQLPGGKTLQLSGSQAVHLTSAQSVQLPSGHTLQLSSLQIPTQSVRLPNGQTVQLTTTQPLRTIPASAVKKPQTMPTIKINTQANTTQPTIQIPLSSVQIGGQTVQLSGHSLQLAGQNVKLSGGKIELSANNLPQGSQVAGQLRDIIANTRAAAAASQAETAGTSGQTSQSQAPSMEVTPPAQFKPHMLTGHTVQLPSGQTFQLGTQTVQLPSGQTFQLSGSALRLTQVFKNAQAAAQAQSQAGTSPQTEKPPIIAKVLTNAQGQVIKLENVMGGRTIHLSGLRPQKPAQANTSVAATIGAVSAANISSVASTGVANIASVASTGGASVRVVTNSGTRMNRPMFITTKPMPNIILQPGGDAANIKSAASAPPTTSQAIVISSIAPSATSNTPSPPVIKLHQGGAPLNVSASSGVRNMLMEGQQFKFVDARNVIARFLRASAPQPPPTTQ